MRVVVVLILYPLVSFAHEWVSGEYIVRLRPGNFLGFDGEFLGNATYKINTGVGSLSNQISVPDILFCEEILRNNPELESCSPNYIVKTSTIPNDPLFTETWGLANAPKAWGISTGDEQIVVAVVDTGIDYTHPDLEANMWRNPAEAFDGIDNDGNGIIDDVFGYNAITRTGNPFDDHGHGTHCAGTIGAVGGNGIGVAGVNWNVKLMALKFLNANGSGDLAGAIRAINYVTDQKIRGVNVRVINSSWGGGGYSAPLEAAIKASNDAGIVFVAAAGNSSNNNDTKPSYPANYPGVISVAAISQGNNLATFSNYGRTTVQIAAPGVSILSTLPGNRYGRMSGTSMAAPHISGAIALLFSVAPELSDVKTRLFETGLVQSSLIGMISGGRVLDLERLLKDERSNNTPSEGCRYTVSNIPYNPDKSIWREVPIAGSVGDDVEVIRSISGTFFGSNTLYLSLSSNQVIYFGRPRESYDFDENRSTPGSLKILNSDWLAKDGIRSRTRSDGALVVGFKGSLFGGFIKGSAKSVAHLYPNGVIDTFTDISDDLRDFLGSKSKVSLVSLDGTEVGYKARNKSAYRFTPSCGQGVILNKLKASLSEAKLILKLKGIGTGIVPVRFKVNGKNCSKSTLVPLINGNGKRVTKLPRFKRLTIEASATGVRSNRARATGYSRITGKEISKVCRKLYK